MVKHYTDYAVVQKYPVIKGYLDHYRRVSKNNDIPGFLSFFFVQGQLTAPFVRIPIDDIHLDTSIHVFWIQGSRTGKSISWGFVAKMLRELDLTPEVYTEGTDAGLIGGWDREETDEGIQLTIKEGLLAGHKALNFDEGSVLLKPGKFSQNTVLYLQTACNPIGSEENTLKKHTKDGPIELESMVSLWITTYPPNGVKEYVLNKGIFQRVLLFWRNWTMDMLKGISEERAILPWGESSEATMELTDIVEYFKELQGALTSRVLSFPYEGEASCGFSGGDLKGTKLDILQWEELDRSEQEKHVQRIARKLFTKDETFNGSMLDAVDAYYSMVRGMDPKLGEVVASFIPGVVNYTIILSTHLAMVEGVWKVTGDHVHMATEILYDLFQNLILWLEEEVEVGAKAGERRSREAAWKEGFAKCEKYDLDDRRGDGWVRKSQLLEKYGQAQNLSRNSCFTHFERGGYMFNVTREGPSIYVRLKEDYS